MTRQMKDRVSIRDLAKSAGVSRTTVSLALRDSHKISLAVRKRIQELAERSNYRSHPIVSALMRQIRVKRRVRYEEVVAFISSDLSQESWKAWGWNMEMWGGAAAEANRLGFRLESFWAGPAAANSRQLANTLYHRGIRGLIFAPMPWPHPVFSMPWEKFVSVACTASTGIKELPVVRSNHSRGMIQLLRKLGELGAKSIGIVITEEDDLRIERAWSTGVGSYCLDDGRNTAHLLRLSSYSQFKEFASWFRRVRPDVVVLLRKEVLSFLEKLGLRPGTDIAWASLNVASAELESTAGLYQDPAYLGARAVQFISNVICDQTFGLPEHAESVLVDGRFVGGTSLAPLINGLSRKPSPSRPLLAD